MPERVRVELAGYGGSLRDHSEHHPAGKRTLVSDAHLSRCEHDPTIGAVAGGQAMENPANMLDVETLNTMVVIDLVLTVSFTVIHSCRPPIAQQCQVLTHALLWGAVRARPGGLHVRDGRPDHRDGLVGQSWGGRGAQHSLQVRYQSDCVSAGLSPCASCTLS